VIGDPPLELGADQYAVSEFWVLAAETETGIPGAVALLEVNVAVSSPVPDEFERKEENATRYLVPATTLKLTRGL
jgi:hypothetical protein